MFGSANTGLDAAAAAAAAASAAEAEAAAAGLAIGRLNPHQAIVLDEALLAHHQPDVLALARRLVDCSTAIACLGSGSGFGSGVGLG